MKSFRTLAINAPIQTDFLLLALAFGAQITSYGTLEESTPSIEMTYFEAGQQVTPASEEQTEGVAGLTFGKIYTVQSYEPHGGFVVIINDNGFYKSFCADRFVLSQK